MKAFISKHSANFKVKLVTLKFFLSSVMEQSGVTRILRQLLYQSRHDFLKIYQITLDSEGIYISYLLCKCSME